MQNADWQSRYEVMLDAARAAGDHALQYFDTGVAVETKSDDSPVTRADREGEELLRKMITARFPDDGFLGEEYGAQDGPSGYRWIIDPVDGTRSFIRNVPVWGTLVGLEYRGEPVAGATYIPCWKQMFHALRGNGAYRDGRRIQVSSVPRLEQAVISFSTHDYFKAPPMRSALQTLLDTCQRSRSYGDFYGFMLLAQGSVDLMVDHGVHVWDVAGLRVIVEEAGGRFTDWRGVARVDRPDVVASNGAIHAQALEILRPAAPGTD